MASSSILLTKRTTGASSPLRWHPLGWTCPRYRYPVLEVDIVEACETVGSAFEQLVDGQAKLVVFDQNRFGRQAGAELDIIDGLVVGGSEMPTKSLLPRRHRGMTRCWRDQLFADGVPRKAFLVQAIQVAIGDAELLGGHPARARPLTSFVSAPGASPATACCAAPAPRPARRSFVE